MAKKINSDSMSALFNGLTGAASENSAVARDKVPAARANTVSKESTKKEILKRERICTLVESEVMAKIRVISEKEGISIASMFNLGLKVILENYEKKYGKVVGRSYKRGNIDEVFDI